MIHIWVKDAQALTFMHLPNLIKRSQQKILLTKPITNNKQLIVHSYSKNYHMLTTNKRQSDHINT